MAANVGNLNVKITSDASQFSRGLNKANTDTRGFVAKTKKAGGGVEGLIGTIGKLNSGFSILTAAAVGMGAAVGGDLVQNVFKAGASLLGYDEQANKAKESTDALSKSLEMQIRHFGKSASEIERLNAIQNKATASDARRVKILRDKLNALNETKKSEDEVKKILEGLETAKKNFGKSAEEIKLARLETLKASDANKQHAATLIAQVAALKAQKAAQDAANKSLELSIKNIRKQRDDRAKALGAVFDARRDQLHAAQQTRAGQSLAPQGARFGADAQARIAEITARRSTEADKYNQKQLDELKAIRAQLVKIGAITPTTNTDKIKNANF
jgi:chromosome segregation ATPase